MDPQAYINKVRDINIKMALSIIAEKLRSLGTDRVKAIEDLLRVDPTSSREETGIFYQLVEDENGNIVPQRRTLSFNGFRVLDIPLLVKTTVTNLHHVRANFGVDGEAHEVAINLVGDIVKVLPYFGEVGVEFDNYGSAANTICQGNDPRLSDARTANKIRETSGPTDLTVGAIVNGEFLKRVGATVVSAVAEANTASNAGVGIGVFKDKLGVDLRFKSITAGTAVGGISVAEPGAGTITIDGIAATTAVKGVVELATSGENAANVVVQGNDARLSDARTPTAHKTSHQSGGSDAIPLDTLAAPTDIVTLNSSTTAHGLLKKLSNVATEFINGQGNWAVPCERVAVASLKQITVQGWVDITGLTFAVTSGVLYRFRAFIMYQSSDVNMGVWFGVNGPAMSFLFVKSEKQITVGGTASTDMFSEGIITAFDTANPASVAEPAAATNLLCVLEGVFVPSANGTFAIRMNKENVAGTASAIAFGHVIYRSM